MAEANNKRQSVTSQTPVLPANAAAAASASPEHALQLPGDSSAQGAGQAFSHILRAQPAQSSGTEAPVADGAAPHGRRPIGGSPGPVGDGTAGGKALPGPAQGRAVGSGGGGSDPAVSRGTAAPMAAAGARGRGVGSGGKDEGRSGAPLPPELMDMLKALLDGNAAPQPPSPAPTPGRAAAAHHGGADDRSAPGADELTRLLARLEAQAGASGVGGQDPSVAGSPDMARLLQHLTALDGGRDAADQAIQRALAQLQGGTGRPDHAGGALAPLFAAGADGSGSPVLNGQQQPPPSPGGSGAPVQPPAAQTAVQAAAQIPANPDINAVMEQILARVGSAKSHATLNQDLTGGDRRGGKVSAGTPAGGSSAPAFSTVYTHLLTPAHTSAGTAPVAPMPQPFNQQAWDDALGKNVMWMARHNVQSASLQLNPPDLGPLELKVSVTNDQANVSFVVHHAAVRDAIEGALPRLRELFGDGGVNLGNVNVSDHSASGDHAAGSDQGSGNGPGHSALARDAGTSVGDISAGPAAPVSLGLVDYFA